jgi:alpha-1,6-mannosyltransferase
MLAAMTAGVYALLRHRQRTGGALVMLAAGVKLTAGLVLPFAAAAPEGLGGTRRRRNLLIGAGATGIALLTLGIAEFGSGTLHLPSTLAQTQSEGDWHSIPGFVSTRLGLGTIGHVTGLLLGLAFLAAFIFLLVKVWRGEMDWIDGAAWAALAMLVTASAVLPWYVAWLMPLVALGTDRRLWRASLIITGVVTGIQFLGFIPHAAMFGL